MAIRQEGNTYYGLSTDTKPTGAVLNGREFKEMDTGKKYLFDAENGEWLEQPEEGGGGGGGSSTLSGLTDVDISNPSDGQTLVYNATSGKWENGAGGGALVVTLDKSNDYRADKTSAEIFDAITRAVFRAAVGPGVFQLFTLQIYGKVVDSEDTYYTFIIGEYFPESGYEQIELMGIGGDSYPQMTND